MKKIKLLFIFLLTYVHCFSQCETTETFNFTGSLQTFTVPANVSQIQVNAAGASGGDYMANGQVRGNGARITGTYTVIPGETLQILVGGRGFGTIVNPLIDERGGGGGGATILARGTTGFSDFTPANTLFIAGAGGGAGFGGTGGDAILIQPAATGNGGAAGNSGNGVRENGGGATLLNDGGGTYGGKSIVTGGQGGSSLGVGVGGFGGGGGTGTRGGGAGAGASGGNGGVFQSPSGVQGGQGGTSYNSDSNGQFFAGDNTENGFVEITYNPDVTPPMALCQDITIQLDTNGNASITASDIDGGSTDNCSIDTLTIDINSFNCSNLGMNNVVLTVTDTNGNSSTCTAIVTVEDSTPPVITCPSDITVDNDPGACGAIVSFTATAIDSCPGPVTFTYSQDPGTQFPVGTTVVTATATDGEGNSSNCSFTITVNDIEAPTITCPADITANSDPSSCGAIVNYVVATNDNCSSGGTTSITFSYTGSVQQFVVPPGVTQISAQVYGAQGGANWVNNVNYGGLVTADIPVVPGQTLFIYVGEQPTGLSGGWNGGGNGETDGAGGGGASDIRIGGTSLNDRVIVAGAGGGAGFWSGMHVVGGLGGDLVGGQGYRGTPANPGGEPGTQTSSGNGTCVTFNNPLVSGGFGFGGSSNSCGCEGYGGGGGYYGGAGSGNCRGGGGGSSFTESSLTNVIHSQGVRAGNGEIVLTLSSPLNTMQTAGLPSGSTFPVGTTTNTFVVTDNAGNTATCSFDVTINDIENPVITCPSDISINNSLGECSAIVTFNATATDNCSVVVTYSQNPGTSFTVGTTTVTATATDPSGNIATCMFDVTVVDNEPPTAICQDITIQLDASGNASILASDVEGGSLDNCGVASLSVSPSTFDCSSLGTNTVTLTVTDTSGNTNTCNATVTVEDNIDPTITCPANIIQDVDSGICGAIITYTEPVGADSCSNSVTTQTDTTGLSSGDVFPVGTTTLEYTVTDSSGNTAVCTFDITVEDTENPIPVCMDITVSLDENGMYVLDPSEIDGGSTDNCDPSPILFVFPDTFTCDDIGTNNVTLTVTDSSGNANVCGAVVTVIDNTPPTISCPANIVASSDPGLCSTIVNFGTAIALDNCDVTVTQTMGPTSGSNFPVGFTTIEFTTIDAGGNNTSCQFVVEVLDTETPTLICNDSVATTDSGNCDAVVTYNLPMVNDNCPSPPEAIVGFTSLGGFNGKTYYLSDAQFTAEDAFIDAQANGGFVVTINDITENNFLNTTVNASIGTPTSFWIGYNDVDDEGTFKWQNGDPSAFTNWSSGEPNDFGAGEDYAELRGDNSLWNDLGSTSARRYVLELDGAFELISGLPSGSTFPVGVTTISYMYTDGGGNNTSCSFDVIVNDEEAPLAVCQDITIELDANGITTIVPNDIDGGSSDACGIDTLTVDIDTFDCSNVGANNVVLTVTDVNGNSSTCSAIVTVVDTIAPSLVCQPATITIGADGTATVDPLLLIDQTNPLDNCTIDSLATNAGTLDCSDVGSTITVTVFAVDVNGNIASCETTLTIEDSLGPVFDQGTLPEDTARDPEANGIYTLEDFTVGVAASDNCSEPLLPIVIAQDPAPGTPLGVGVYDITLTAVDDLGNQSEYVFELTVNPILGVEDTSFSSLSLYPNPASDRITLSNPNNLDFQEVVIYDLMGRLVTTINLNDMSTEKTIDVSLLQSATYMILIKGKQGITTKQLIIE